MWSAAEVEEFAVAIEADALTTLGELLNEVDLHEVALLQIADESFIARDVFVAEWLVARDDFRHLRFNGGKVFRREWLLAEDVVEEAAVGGGAVAELHFRIQLRDGRSHDVCSRVAHNAQGFGIVLLQ